MYTFSEKQVELITRFDEVNEILRDRRFAGGAGRPFGRAFLGGSLVTIDGPEHLARRRMYLPFQLEPQLKHYERDVTSAIVERCLALATRERDAEGVARVDLVALAKDIFMRIAATMIGFDDVDDEKASSRLYEVLAPLSAGVTIEWAPGNRDEIMKRGLVAKESLREEFFQPAFDRRKELVAAHERGAVQAEDLPVDVLTLLLRNWDPAWEDDLALRESILFLAGATGNPVGQIVYVVEDLWAWLAVHPEESERLSDERFLRDAINETLRLHIAGSPVLVREATEDVELRSSGRRVAQGEQVGLDMIAANHDTDTFGNDAESYDPHRRQRLGDRVKPFGVAFGGGAHVCLGRPLMLGREIGVDIEGLEFLILRRLLDEGIERDEQRSPRRADSGQQHYEFFPVTFPRRDTH